jgi:glycosyltransferase involved in cell wall biosynthesis
MHKLAIIIPVYKADFFREALTSIATQTSMDFHLYIGNDNSPDNIDDIVNEFKDKIDITYVKFEENIGGKDLVAQWERCIELSKNEEWIWLFSDDDVMAPNCVEEFCNNLNSSEPTLLYHFNVSVINSKGDVIEPEKPFPGKVTAYDFLMGKISGNIKSYVVEYIFSRKSYKEFKGFPKFDLAWNSDDAMWFQLAWNSEIRTLIEGKVFWRASGINISRNQKNREIAKRKLKADLAYLKWLQPKINVFKGKQKNRLEMKIIYWFFRRVQFLRGTLDNSFLEGILADFHKSLYPDRFTFFIQLRAIVRMSILYRKVNGFVCKLIGDKYLNSKII